MLEVRHLAIAGLLALAGVTGLAVGCANGDPTTDDSVSIDGDDAGGGGTTPQVEGGTGSSGNTPPPGGKCKTKADCASDQICDTATGTCVGCIGDGDCPPGKTCDLPSKTCKDGCNATHACDKGKNCCGTTC